MFAHPPGKGQGLVLRVGRPPLGHHLAVSHLDPAGITLLIQQAAGNRLGLVAGRLRVCDLRDFQQPDVLEALGRGQHLQGRGRIAGGQHDFKKALFVQVQDFLGGRRIDLAIQTHDPAKNGNRIAGARLPKGVGQRLRRRGHAARVGMLDGHRGSLIKLLDQGKRGVGIHNIIIRQLLALELFSVGDTRLPDDRAAVKGRRLVRVFSVAEVLGLDVLQVQGFAKRPAFFSVEAAQVVGNGTVVAGGQPEGFLGQGELVLGRQGAVRRERGQHGRIIVRVHHNAHVGVILGRGAQQGRPADIDVLDRVGKAAVRPGHGLFKRVEVDHHQIDGFEVVLGHGLKMAGVAPAVQNAGVYAGVQGLHPAVEHFGKAGKVFDRGHGKAGVGQRFGRAAG